MQHFVILTFDTEFSNHRDEMGVWYEKNGEKYGLDRILTICREFDIKATFFVDVYQKEQQIQKACEQILKQGHDIQLHTHPNWRYDRKRQNLACYTLSEQTEIIGYGKQKLRQWTGMAPTGHRAGDFGANENTLKALAKNQIFNDYSYYWNWPDCELSRQYDLKNQISQINSILEVPVTFFYMPCGLKCVKYRLIDINEPLFLLKYIFQKFKMYQMQTIVITLHSFSFIGYNEIQTRKYRPRQHYWPLKHHVKKFVTLLNLLKSDKAFKFITASEFYKIAQNDIRRVQNPAFIPKINLIESILWQGDKLINKSLDRVYQYYRTIF